MMVVEEEFKSEFPSEFMSFKNTYSIQRGNLSLNTVSSTNHLFLVDYTSTANMTAKGFQRDLPRIRIWNPEIIMKLCRINYLIIGRWYLLNGTFNWRQYGFGISQYFVFCEMMYVKLRHYEKATKFEKISHLFWRNSCFYSVASKQVGDFFKFFGLFRKAGL